MSTIFGHGRLRLYLLKLLDESPRHGYEIISLLRDRFMGVYSPSPGTIYPRLARLEEEGLVTHEEVNDRKVYRLTDKGRQELHDRGSDLDDLEREIAESVRDVARTVTQDVRDTISSLREELKGASASGRRTTQGESGYTDSGSRDSEDDTRDSTGKEKDTSWWDREWGRFAHGFGVWGSWGKRDKGGEGPDFEQTLRDFSDRVRDVVRDAGQVGESAAQNLRRILDDTIEVIRRDASSWGPSGNDTDRDSAAGERGDAETAREKGDGKAGGAEAPRGPFAQPPADRDAADPWSTAVREDTGQQDTKDDPGDESRA